MAITSTTTPEMASTTPPQELRTDPERGTGELGMEGVDPAQPAIASQRELWGLYGSKDNQSWRLTATFDTFEQLRSYVRWATLKVTGDNSGKYEQGSALAGLVYWRESPSVPTEELLEDVPHNPSPSML